MPNASDGMNLGGGALAYPTGKEVFVDLTSADATLTSATHGNKALVAYSDRPSRKLTLPSASSLAKRHYGVMVPENSVPIPVYNAGTAGTDPVLEGVLVPNAAGRFFTATTADAKGTWSFAGKGFMKTPWPVGGADLNAGTNAIDTGGTSFGTADTIGANRIAALTETLVAHVYVDGANDVIVYFAKLQSDGTFNYSSTGTALSHATDVYSYCQVFRLRATKVVVAAYNSTQSRMEYAIVNVTDAATPTLGTIGSAFTEAAVTHKILGTSGSVATVGITVDTGVSANAEHFWVTGPKTTDNSVVVRYCTVATNTISQGGEYNDSTMTGYFCEGIISDAAATAYRGVTAVSSSTGSGVRKFTYSGGVISVAWTAIFRTPHIAGASSQANLLSIDTTNGYAWLTNATSVGDNNFLIRVKFNTSTGAVHNVAIVGGVSVRDAGGLSHSSRACAFSSANGPDIVFHHSAGATANNAQFVGYNANTLLAGHVGMPQSSYKDRAEFSPLLPKSYKFMPKGAWYQNGGEAGVHQGYGFHATSRRIFSATFDRAAISSGNYKIQLIAYDIPKSLAERV